MCRLAVRQLPCIWRVLLIVLLFACAAALVLPLDHAVSGSINKAALAELDFPLQAVTGAGEGLVVVLVFLLLAIFLSEQRLAVVACSALGTTGLLVQCIKLLTYRVRPNMADAASFPSGHAAAAFAAAVLLARRYPRWRWLFYACAALIGASRVLLGAHYLSDVFAGAGAGVLVGSAACMIAGNLDTVQPKKWAWVMAIALSAGLCVGMVAVRPNEKVIALGGPVLLLIVARLTYARTAAFRAGLSERSRQTAAAALVTACAALVFLPGLGRVALFDRDEPRFAEAARQMMARGDYLVPYFNGEPRLHKPPLSYWVMTAGYRTLGVNEWGARIGSALAGVLTCLLVFLLAHSAFNLRTGVIAGIATATSLEVMGVARMATADSMQLLTVVACFFGFWKVFQGDRRLRWYLLLYGSVMAGGLLKGPVVAAVLLLAALLLALLLRDRSVLSRLHLVSGLLAATALVCIWFIPADRATHGAFAKVGIGRHIIDRAFSSPMEGHKGYFFYYIALLPIAFFPWILLLPSSAVTLWRDPEGRRRAAFFLAWAAAPFLMFSFLKTKLPHYVLPAFPALAIMVAFGLDRAMDSAGGMSRRWVKWLGIIPFCIVALALMTALAVLVPYRELEKMEVGALAAATLLCVMAWLALADVARRKDDLMAVDLGGGMVLFALLIGAFCLPQFNRYSVTPALARAVREASSGEEDILSLGYREPSLVFYSRRHVVLCRWAAVAERLQEGRPFICVADESHLKKMPVELKEKLDVVGSVSGVMPSTAKWGTLSLLAPRNERSGPGDAEPAQSGP